MLEKIKLLTVKMKSYITGGKVKKGNDGGYAWVGSKEPANELIIKQDDSKPETVD